MRKRTKSDTFTIEEYGLIREGLFFMESRKVLPEINDLIRKLDKLFLLPAVRTQEGINFTPNPPENGL